MYQVPTSEHGGEVLCSEHASVNMELVLFKTELWTPIATWRFCVMSCFYSLEKRSTRRGFCNHVSEAVKEWFNDLELVPHRGFLSHQNPTDSIWERLIKSTVGFTAGDNSEKFEPVEIEIKRGRILRDQKTYESMPRQCVCLSLGSPLVKIAKLFASA